MKMPNLVRPQFLQPLGVRSLRLPCDCDDLVAELGKEGNGGGTNAP